MTEDIIFWAVVVLASVAVGFSKSGLISALGMIGVPILTFVMSPREAAGMMLPVLLAMDAVAFYSHRKSFNKKVLIVMLPAAIVGIGIGWALSSIVNDAMVLLVLGIITFAFVIDAWFPLRKRLEVTDGSPFWARFWGTIAGFTSFVTHAGGPPYQIYTLPLKMKPALYAGTAVWFFTTVNILKIIPYFMLGQISFSSLQVSAVAAPVGIAAVMVGVWLVKRISMKAFYNIAYSLMFLMSLKLIFDGLQLTLFG